ncbi:unnamed protein product [Effrenium voratum]|nr:unnamed protein product [Effrenium voratum]
MSEYHGMHHHSQYQQWSWRTDAPEFTPGTTNPNTVSMMSSNGNGNNAQMMDNTVFFAPFPGWFMPTGDMSMQNMGENAGNFEAEANQVPEVAEMEAKVASMQQELAQVRRMANMERRLRQIQTESYRRVLETYFVPREDAEQLVRRNDGYLQMEAQNTPGGVDLGEESQIWSQVHTPAESPDSSTTASADGKASSGTASGTSIASALQAMFPHATVRTSFEEETADMQKADRLSVLMDNLRERLGKAPSPEDANASGTCPTSKSEEEEVHEYVSRLERMVSSTVDDRAKNSLMSLSPKDGKDALRKVEEIINQQGGSCRHLSSILQSVCRKLDKRRI